MLICNNKSQENNCFPIIEQFMSYILCYGTVLEVSQTDDTMPKLGSTNNCSTRNRN